MTGPDTLRRNGSSGLRHLRPVEKRFSTGVILSLVTLRHIGAIFTGPAARPVAAQWVWVISGRSVRINGGALAAGLAPRRMPGSLPLSICRLAFRAALPADRAQRQRALAPHQPPAQRARRAGRHGAGISGAAAGRADLGGVRHQRWRRAERNAQRQSLSRGLCLWPIRKW